MAKWAVALALCVACLAVASPAYGAGESNATAGGADASAAGKETAVSAADGGASSSAASAKDSASASAAVTAAATAAGGFTTLPSLSAAPATTIVQPVLPPTLQTAFSGVVVDQVVSFSEQYCTAASFEEGKDNAANYTGPGMTIAFTTGACKVPYSEQDFNGFSSDLPSSSSASGSASSGRKLFQASSNGSASGDNSSASAAASVGDGGGGRSATLDCIEPTLVVTKTPAIYTSAYHSAPTFTGKECKVQPTIGEETAEILYTFDDATPIDPLSLANLIQAKLATILQEGYQDLIKQIASSASFAPGATGLAGGSASASAAASGV